MLYLMSAQLKLCPWHWLWTLTRWSEVNIMQAKICKHPNSVGFLLLYEDWGVMLKHSLWSLLLRYNVPLDTLGTYKDRAPKDLTSGILPEETPVYIMRNESRIQSFLFSAQLEGETLSFSKLPSIICGFIFQCPQHLCLPSLFRLSTLCSVK